MSLPLHAPLRWPLLAAGLTVLLAACGSPSASPSFSPIPPAATSGPSDPPPASPSPSQASVPGLLLEVTSEGGFINPIASLSAPPQVVVDDDGRIYTPDANAAGAGGLVPAVVVRDVGRDGAARILEAIRAAGLDHEASGGGVAADTGSTVFTAVVDGNLVTSTFTRGGGSGPGIPGGIGGPGASGGPGAAAFALLAQLTDPSVTWGAASAPAEPYAPVGFKIYEAPATPADTAGAAVAWPLATGLAEFGDPAVPDLGATGLRSGIVTGSDAASLASLLATATPDTTFTSGGRSFRLWVQPLFPDAVGR